MKLRSLILAGLALLLVACVPVAKHSESKMEEHAVMPPPALPQNTCDKSNFAGYIEKADSARKKADKVGHGWTKTKGFVLAAKKYAVDGNFDDACKNAHQAYVEGLMGYYQWESQKNPGPLY